MNNRESSWTLTPRSLTDPSLSAHAECLRVPRITKLMALAIKLDEQVRTGVFGDYAEIARLGYVTRARLTQIMNLLNLAPEMIEELLLLPISGGQGLVPTERAMRRIASRVLWSEQLQDWHATKKASVTLNPPPAIK